MHGNVCANRDSEERIIDIKNGAEKNFRIIFYIIIGNVEKSKKKTKKFVDDQYSVCYISLAMEVGLFFMPFFRRDKTRKLKRRWKLCVQRLH